MTERELLEQLLNEVKELKTAQNEMKATQDEMKLLSVISVRDWMP